MVKRKGEIFVTGNYPEKNFSLSEAEVDQAIAHFKPVSGDVEHMPTVLSGHLGTMERIWREGPVVFGEVDIPDWLHNALDRSKSKVSCAWDRETKMLEGWGWVIDPHLPNAALFTGNANAAPSEVMLAAFNKHNADQGDAVVNTLNPAMTNRQKKEKRFMPLIDSIRKGMAKFNQDTPVQAPATPAPTTTTTTTPAPAPTPEPVPAPAPTTTTTTVATPATPAAPAPVVNFSAPGVEVEDMDDATADFKAQQIITRATEQADALIKGRHLHSSGRDAAIAAFTAAGFDNEAQGPSLVTFTRNDNSVVNDRISLLAEVFKSVPKHSLFSSDLPVYTLNGSSGDADKLTPEEQGKAQVARFNKAQEELQAANASLNGHAR